MPSAEGISRFRRAREKHDLAPLVIHDNYLINLAAADPALRQKSVDAFRGEIERALAIGAEYLVAHPGNYKGLTLEQGLQAVVESLALAARGLRGPLTILLENTAGAGAQIGGRFEELAILRQCAEHFVDLPVGFCLDTCHLLVSGYDISTAAGLRETLRAAELDHVKVIHANDSKAPLGSHVDRHQNIGEGYIGLEGFRRILTDKQLKSKAFVLETPIDNDGDDLKNVETLKSLCRKRPTSTNPSS